jgi:hypothetical protein
MTQEADALERMIREDKTKLSELPTATDDAWESIKGGIETTWGR